MWNNDMVWLIHIIHHLIIQISSHRFCQFEVLGRHSAHCLNLCQLGWHLHRQNNKQEMRCLPVRMSFAKLCLFDENLIFAKGSQSIQLCQALVWFRSQQIPWYICQLGRCELALLRTDQSCCGHLDPLTWERMELPPEKIDVLEYLISQ